MNKPVFPGIVTIENFRRDGEHWIRIISTCVPPEIDAAFVELELSAYERAMETGPPGFSRDELHKLLVLAATILGESNGPLQG
jgi:hypothetical protein